MGQDATNQGGLFELINMSRPNGYKIQQNSMVPAIPYLLWVHMMEINSKKFQADVWKITSIHSWRSQYRYEKIDLTTS
jgi:hypothetical protein